MLVRKSVFFFNNKSFTYINFFYKIFSILILKDLTKNYFWKWPLLELDSLIKSTKYIVFY